MVAFVQSLMCNRLFSTVQEHSTSANLVLATLETLLKFLNWIPLGYIFETDLIDSLIKKVLVLPSACANCRGLLIKIVVCHTCTHYTTLHYTLLCFALLNYNLYENALYLCIFSCAYYALLCFFYALSIYYALLQFFLVPMFRNVTLKCLTEIGVLLRYCS